MDVNLERQRKILSFWALLSRLAIFGNLPIFSRSLNPLIHDGPSRLAFSPKRKFTICRGPASLVQVDYPIMIIIYNNNNIGLKRQKRKMHSAFSGSSCGHSRNPPETPWWGTFKRVQRGRWFWLTSLFFFFFFQYYLCFFLMESLWKAGSSHQKERRQTTERERKGAHDGYCYVI